MVSVRSLAKLSAWCFRVLLFLLYINDLYNLSKVVDFILFADDTNIFFSHKDLNSEMLKLTQ